MNRDEIRARAERAEWSRSNGIALARDVLALLDANAALEAAIEFERRSAIEIAGQRDDAEAEVVALRAALERIAALPGRGASGTGASGWLLTLDAPEIARAALAREEQ